MRPAPAMASPTYPTRSAQTGHPPGSVVL
jgi:hypothetical protein